MGAAHPGDIVVPLLVASFAGVFAGLLYTALALRVRVVDAMLVVPTVLVLAAVGTLVWLTYTRRACRAVPWRRSWEPGATRRCWAWWRWWC